MEEQVEQNQNWLQKNKQLLIIATVIILVLLLIFALAVHWFGWDWTGFTSVTGPTLQSNEQYQPAKTLWDVLQLLIVPIILAIGGFWLNQIQKVRDQKAEEAQKRREVKAAEEREKLERESREDNQREAALQAYFDNMANLLPAMYRDETSVMAQELARIRTLTVLTLLDGKRKGSVLQFLYEAHLLYKHKTKVFLGTESAMPDPVSAYLGPSTSDLRGADLRGADLRARPFCFANFSRVDLRGADLRGADLSFADLRGTNLGMADLTEANLTGADLGKIEIQPSDLEGLQDPRKDIIDLLRKSTHYTNLSDANLSKADLRKANGITVEELEKQAKSLQGAIMPDGSIHP